MIWCIQKINKKLKKGYLLLILALLTLGVRTSQALTLTIKWTDSITNEGGEFILPIAPKASLELLKQKIANQQKVDKERIALIYAGKELENDALLLENYNIDGRQKIYVVFRKYNQLHNQTSTSDEDPPRDLHETETDDTDEDKNPLKNKEKVVFQFFKLQTWSRGAQIGTLVSVVVVIFGTTLSIFFTKIKKKEKKASQKKIKPKKNENTSPPKIKKKYSLAAH